MKTPVAVCCLSLVLAGALLAACSAQKGPAERAIADIQAAVQDAGPDAQRLLPDQVARVNKQLDGLNAAFHAGDYDNVVAGAPAVLAAAKALPAATAIEKKRDEALKAQWSTLASSLPKELESIDRRITRLEKSRRLPQGVDSKRLASAAETIKGAEDAWHKSASEFDGGHVNQAVSGGTKVRTEVRALMSELGMKETASGHS